MDDVLIDDSYLSDLPLWADEDARAVLERVCEEHKVPLDVIDRKSVV